MLMARAAGCCARTPSGQAAVAPPIKLMNSRRLKCRPPLGRNIVPAFTGTLEGLLSERIHGFISPLHWSMSALGHVWTAPWQELSDAAAALVGCGHVSGLFVRRSSRWP